MPYIWYVSHILLGSTFGSYIVRFISEFICDKNSRLCRNTKIVKYKNDASTRIAQHTYARSIAFSWLRNLREYLCNSIWSGSNSVFMWYRESRRYRLRFRCYRILCRTYRTVAHYERAFIPMALIIRMIRTWEYPRDLFFLTVITIVWLIKTINPLFFLISIRNL